MRVVLDSNVVLSALFFDGVAAAIHRWWKKRSIEPAATKEMMREYARVLTYKKFQLDADEIAGIFDEEIFPYFAIVPRKKHPVPYPPEDPDDVPFIAAALDGNAEFVVSGDVHLLALDGKYDFPVVRPGEFLERFGRDG